MNTPKFNTWADHFNWLKEIEFRMYETPALPGGDLGMFPAAHPRPTRAEQQSAFLRNMLETGKGWSDLTSQECKQAEALGWKLPTFTPCCGQPQPLNWRCL